MKQNAPQARFIKQNAPQTRIFDEVLMGTLSYLYIVCNLFSQITDQDLLVLINQLIN